MKTTVITGLESILADPPEMLEGRRIGLLANPASVSKSFEHAAPLIAARFPGQLTALFSPQHGFYAEKQDNMIESGHFTEPDLKIPVFSLYSSTRIPTKEMFDLIDVLLVDIQDVGTRVYTFIYTVSYCLETAARLNKKVILLDRPNPIGGARVEGNVLSEGCRSFVGRFPIPMRHGMTIGEISRYFNTQAGIHADLTVIPLKHWRRDMAWDKTGLAWIAPSPNLPTPRSCMVYPGQVIFEGTNISEGRGTTLPFEQFGAPFLDTTAILQDARDRIQGAVLRPVNFEPTSGKWQGQVCRGFQIHVTAADTFKPYFTSLLLLQLIIRHHGDNFEFKPPPYEYEYKRLPMDLILGSQKLRQDIAAQKGLNRLSEGWQKDLEQFRSTSKRYYLYD